MTPRRDTFDLLMRHLDGRLSGDDLRALNDTLRTDARARDWLREIAGQAVAMGDLARGRGAGERPAAPPPSVRRASRWSPLAWAASLTLLASAAVFGWRWVAAHPVAILVESTGSVAWTGARGGPKAGLTEGAPIGNGTLETVGAVASARLRLRDGTELTLGGGSEIVLAADGQKRVELKGGSLTASVARQPPGRPMLVRTATAEMEVLGTVFSVDVQPDQTRLGVEEGSVRLRRLVDGRAIDVDARHGAVASLDARGPLAATASAPPPRAWRFDAVTPPGSGLRGEVRAAEGATPARVHGVPLVMGRRQDGTPIVHHGVSVREPPRRPAGAFVTLAAGSHVTLRWRTERPGGLFVFLATQRPGGGFGGNFECKLPADAGAADAGGWRTVSIPVRDFRPLSARHAGFAGKGASLVMVTAYEDDAGLDIADLAIDIREPGAES